MATVKALQDGCSFITGTFDYSSRVDLSETEICGNASVRNSPQSTKKTKADETGRGMCTKSAVFLSIEAKRVNNNTWQPISLTLEQSMSPRIQLFVFAMKWKLCPIFPGIGKLVGSSLITLKLSGRSSSWNYVNMGHMSTALFY